MGVAKYLARRCALGVLTLFAVSLVIFVLTQALGDPAEAILGPLARQPEVLQAKREALGLDRSLVRQYVDWLGGVTTGDWGSSFIDGRPIGSDTVDKIGNSLLLMAGAAIIAIPVSVLVGVRAAVGRDGPFDAVTNAVTLVLVALPEFLIATLLVGLLSVGVFEIFPATSSVRGDVRPWGDLDGMVLPTISMALLAVPYVTRSIRASMSEVLARDYIVTARLNGLSTTEVVWRQALPNALAPTLQVISLSLAYMAGGAVVIETVFNYPGMGSALVGAIKAHDVPVVQFFALFIAAFYVVCTVAADVATVLLTPRLRTQLA